MAKILTDAVRRVRDVRYVQVEVVVLITHNFTQDITIPVINLGIGTIHTNTLVFHFLNVTDHVQTQMVVTVLKKTILGFGY